MDARFTAPRLHRWIDAASGGLLIFMTVWAPWAFGGTTSLSRWILWSAGLLLGLLLAGKHLLRLRTGFTPTRWVEPTPAGRWVVRALAVLTVVGLDYVLFSWFNARASLLIGHRGVDLLYHPRLPVSWLPTTYDAPATLRTFASLLTLALTFWAARDWLLGQSRRERHSDETVLFPPARLRRLLWTLCVSSALLALASIAQRLDGTDRLQWLTGSSLPSPISPATPSWGPFPSRASGAAYFNLIWPVSLGFWWSLRLASLRRLGTARRIGGDASMMLLPATLLMAACPVIAGSRNGIRMTLGLAGASLLVLSAVRWPGGPIRRNVAAIGAVLLLGLAGIVFRTPVQSQFEVMFDDPLPDRTALQTATGKMSADAGWLGTGAGSFPGLYALYRSNPDERWLAHAYNDWWEYRITVGVFGLAVAVLILVLLAVAWKESQGLGAPREFLLLLALSLISFLIQAAFEHPFQVPSLAFTFVLLVAIGLATARVETSPCS